MSGEPAPRMKGVAWIKSEYILSRSNDVEEEDDDAAERATNPATSKIEEEQLQKEENGEERESKKMRLSGGARKKARKEAEWEKKKARGQNKGRKFAGIRDQVSLCHLIAQGKKCNRDG